MGEETLEISLNTGDFEQPQSLGGVCLDSHRKMSKVLMPHLTRVSNVLPARPVHILILSVVREADGL